MDRETALQLITARIAGSSLADFADEIGIPAADLHAFRLGVTMGSMQMARLEAWCGAQRTGGLIRGEAAASPPTRRLHTRRRGGHERLDSGEDEWGFVRGSDDDLVADGPRRIPTGMRSSPTRSLSPPRAAAPRRERVAQQGRIASRGSCRNRDAFASIRAYAIRRVEETSVRRLAAEIGPPMQRSALQLFLQGAEPYARNAAALRAWYARVSAADDTVAGSAKPEDAAWRRVPRQALVDFYEEEVSRTSLKGVARECGASAGALRGFINRSPGAFTSPKVVRKLAVYYLARGGVLTEDRIPRLPGGSHSPFPAPAAFRFMPGLTSTINSTEEGASAQ